MPRIPRKGSEGEEPEATTDETTTEKVGEVPSPVPPLAGDPVVDDVVVVDDAPAEKEPRVESSSAARDRAAAESRVSVVNESRAGGSDSEEAEEYKWHTGAQRPHGAEDAI